MDVDDSTHVSKEKVVVAVVVLRNLLLSLVRFTDKIYPIIHKVVTSRVIDLYEVTINYVNSILVCIRWEYIF